MTKATTQLMTIEEVAAWLRVPKATVYGWRQGGDGPPGIRVGRHLRYDPDAVAAWLRTRSSTKTPNR